MFYPKIQVLLDQGRFTEAEAAIREELQDSIENEFLFYLLAITLLRQDKPKEAENAARQSIALEAEFDLGYFVLSCSLLARENKKEALAAINEAIRIDPEDAAYFSQKAQIFLDWQKFEKSLAAAEQGLAIDPEHDGCRFFRSITLERLGRKEEAEEESLSLLSDDPEDAENHCVRGWVLAQRGETEEAERHFVEALRLDPESSDAKAGLVFAFRMRSPILGTILRILIWLERVPFWLYIVCLFLVINFADSLSDSSLPAPLPQVGRGIRVIFWSFFIVCLLIQPLFNLLIQTSKTARHALSNDERRAVKFYILPLIIALLYLAIWCIFGGNSRFPAHAVTWGAFARMVFEIFETNHRWVRGWITALCFLVFGVVAWVEYYVYGVLLPRQSSLIREFTEAIPKGGPPEDLDEAQKQMMEEFAKRFVAIRQQYLHFVHYPALAVWLIAAFSDNLAGFFRRRAPD